MKTLYRPSAEGRKAERALQKAVARVMDENRRLGLPVAVMRKGRAVLISAAQALGVVREEQAIYKVKHRLDSPDQ